MCRCGLNHRGYEVQLCRIELAKRAHTEALPKKIEAVAALPGKPEKDVTVTKAKEKAVTVTNRMAETRKRKAASGLIQVSVWAHPDDAQAVKELAKRLNEQRAIPKET